MITFPIGYRLNIEKSRCEDIEGNKIDASKVLSSKGNSVTVKSNKTIYCTLYFDYLGTGEKDKPYRIQYIEDLVDLQVSVNNGETYAGKYFELERDLDFQKNDSYRNYKTKEYGDINGNEIDEELKTELTTEKGWKPIGNLNYNFSGIFDGKDNRIDNLIINHTEPNGTTVIYSGLFGRINNAIIKNLTIGGEINIIPNYSVTGGIAGIILNSSVIDNCHNEVNITSKSLGYQNGGILGQANSTTTIKNCSNIGNIRGGNNTGGLVGYNYDTLTIENSYNKGNITNTKGQHAGGLIGRDSTDTNITTIKNSYNEGTVVSNAEDEKATFTGGLIGRVYGTINIDKSHNSGEIRNDRNVYTQASNIPLGGLIGQISGNNKNINRITNSYNEGHLIGATKQGGILGYNITNAITIIDNCYNKGTIESQTIGGNYTTTISGIVGYNYSSKLYILNSHNEGNISSIGYASGICYNDYATQTYIINSYNEGTINGSLATGGLFIVSFNNVSQITLNNIYNLGEVTGNNAYELGYRNGTTSIVEIKNSYYEESKKGTNISDADGTPLPLTDMKSNTLVDKLNTNKNSIDLNSIDSSLSEYTLCNWKQGTSGYPELDC